MPGELCRLVAASTPVPRVLSTCWRAPSVGENQWDEKSRQVSRPRHGCGQADLVWRTQVPARGDQLRGVAVLSLSAEPAHGRGDVGCPRHRGDVRDGAALVSEIRAGHRAAYPIQRFGARGQVAEVAPEI